MLTGEVPASPRLGFSIVDVRDLELPCRRLIQTNVDLYSLKRPFQRVLLPPRKGEYVPERGRL